MRAATATEGELREMLEYAAFAGNSDMARAVFTAAYKKDLGDLMAEYFDKMDPEGRELYQEYLEIPPQEILERQKESVGTLLANPTAEELMPAVRFVS